MSGKAMGETGSTGQIGADDRGGKEGSAKRSVIELTTKTSEASESLASKKARQSSLTAPIKLFATLSDEKERAKNQDARHWSREHCWTLREILGLDGNKRCHIDWLVIANYIINVEFLLNEIPELLSIPQVVVFYGVADTSFGPWQQICNVDAVRLDPSAPPGPNNATSQSIPFGVHHSKIFLIGFSDGSIRVVIHTTNLRYNDIHVKAQAAYVEDFPRKEQDRVGQSSAFEDDLVGYLDTYKYQKKCKWGAVGSDVTLVELVQQYDFASAKVLLVPSTPGYHSIVSGDMRASASGQGAVGSHSSQKLLGHLRVRQIVQDWCTGTEGAGPIVCQFSSMGSLTEKYLYDLQRSFDVRASGPSIAQRAASPTTKLWFVYPTVEEVRSSIEGYAGGNSVPGSRKNVSKPFLRRLYRKWAAMAPRQNPLHKSSNIPHIKTYYQLSHDATSLQWFVLTSHNMSKAAWGDVVNSSRYRRQRLFIRHWELGVFLSPRQFGADRMSPYDALQAHSPGDLVIPLPFPSTPDQYASSDSPWAVDQRYDRADSFGRTSAFDS